MSDATTASSQAELLERLEAGARAWQPQRWALLRRLLRHGTVVAGIAIAGFFILLAIAAPIIAPYDPTAVDSSNILAPPSAEHWFGTDNLGRDTLSRIIYGARLSLGMALLATIAIVGIGMTVGLIAGYAGGILDDLAMRVVDVLLAFPSLVLALVIVGMLGPGLRNVLIGLIAIVWVEYARIVRGITLGVREREFVTSAQCIGCSSPRIILRHIFPNVVPPVIVLASLELGTLILALAGLSFLGLGAQPPAAEWGTMLNDGRPFFQSAPRLMIVPGLTITIAVVGFNLIGDGLRDALDPHLKH